MRVSVASARAFLALIGIVFLIVGAYVAATFDRLIGLGFLVVGAFLLILPTITHRTEE